MIPILLLHGALGSKVQLESLAKRIRENGREVFIMNFSGHGGESFSKEGFGMPAFVDDVTAFMNLHQLAQVDIFGYSMGGYVALLLAKQNPDRVRNIITLGTKFDWSPESAEQEVKKLNPQKIVEKIPAFAKTLELRHQPIDWREVLNKTARMMIALGSQPPLNQKNLNTISHKVLVALGDQDDMADRNYSENVSIWLNGQFRLLPNTPHPIEKIDLNLLVDLIGEWY
jgi:pimeloyl-ACP methyl ester carboxylesterase